MNDRVFGAMVSKSSSKSPNWIPSLNRTAISLNDGVFRTFMNDYQTTLDYVNDRSANVSAVGTTLCIKRENPKRTKFIRTILFDSTVGGLGFW